MDKEILEIRELEAFYHKTQVLHNINLKVKKGEFLCLVGPNGSGKSTLLELMAGIQVETLSWSSPLKKKGITLLGKSIQEYTKKEIAHHIGWTGQKEQSLWNYTVLETTLLGRFSHTNWTGAYTPEDYIIAKDKMEKTGVLPLERRGIHQLSGGECQRVFLARTLAQEPEILLLDEPVSGLDLQYQFTCMNLCKNLAKKENLAIVMTIHDLSLAARFADRIVVLDQGKILADNEPEKALTTELLHAIYGMDFAIEKNSKTHTLEIRVL